MFDPALIEAINADVNRAIAFRAEAPGRDVWTVGPAIGDCEDFALTKHARLLAAGVPAADMAITIVRFPGAQRGRVTMPPRYHAVLIAGGKVLDNENRGDPLTVQRYRSQGWTIVCRVSDLSEGENPRGALARCER